MKQETRNKVGLLLFIFLFLLGGCLVALYVFLGHNWNFAATEIDDVSGNMDEYLVIVYDGTTDVSKIKTASANANSATAAKNTANTESSSSTSNTANSASTAGNASSAEAVGNVATQSAGADVNTGSNAGVATNADADVAANANANTAANTNANTNKSSSNGITEGITGVGERFLRYFSTITGSSVSEEDAIEGTDENSVLTTEIPKGLAVGDVMAIYMTKHAHTLTLYSKDPSHYSEGTVFKKGEYKIGVFGVSSPKTYKEVQQVVDSLKARGATTIMALVANKNYLAAVDGVNIAIVTQGSSAEMKSYGEDGTLYVESSQKGTIDAIIVSPNHIVSTKTL